MFRNSRFRQDTIRLEFKKVRSFLLMLCVGVLTAACGGGSTAPAPPPPVVMPPPPPPLPDPIGQEEASRFLSQATFGPDQAAINDLINKGFDAWLEAEIAKPPTLHLDGVIALFPNGEFLGPNGLLPELYGVAGHSFWDAAITGDDQLRQRMAFALSQIMVVSNNDGALSQAPHMLAGYMDILTEGAFGNYRDLLEDVTYSPAMANYLTYMRNVRGDPVTGRVPDENYARELMQLFTIGLVELNPDGTPKLDGNGDQIELFDNEDITGLAKVFTGLSYKGNQFFQRFDLLPDDAYYAPVQIYPFYHSNVEKTFLDTSISAGTGAEASIDQALDTLFNHPNLPPFISRQLIQRFVTSHPDPAYVARVAAVFEAGQYTLDNGNVVGSGQRGDLAATIAAILMDDEARDLDRMNDSEFGKIREPILRFAHWARAFNVNNADARNEAFLFNTGSTQLLAQQPYGSPSVFNFYRPGYKGAGTATGDAGLTAPELQILNASSIVGYANFMTLFIIGESPKRNQGGTPGFVPDYSAEIALADDAGALVDHLDTLLSAGNLSSATRDRIVQTIELTPIPQTNGDEARGLRVALAIIMVMTSPDYAVVK